MDNKIIVDLSDLGKSHQIDEERENAPWTTTLTYIIVRELVDKGH